MCETIVKDLFSELSDEKRRLMNDLSFERRLNDILVEIKNCALITRTHCTCQHTGHWFGAIARLANDYSRLKYGGVDSRDCSGDNSNGSMSSSLLGPPSQSPLRMSAPDPRPQPPSRGRNGYYQMNGVFGVETHVNNNIKHEFTANPYESSHCPQFTLHIKEEIMDENVCENKYQSKHCDKSDDNLIKSKTNDTLNGCYDHNSEPKVIPICVECFECFESELELEIHMNSVHNRQQHNNAVFVCDDCLPHRVFATADEMSSHIKRHHYNTNGTPHPFSLMNSSRHLKVADQQMNSHLMSDMKRKRGRPKKLVYKPLKINGQIGRPRSLDTNGVTAKNKVGRPPSLDTNALTMKSKVGQSLNGLMSRGKVGRPASVDYKPPNGHKKLQRPFSLDSKPANIKGRVGRPPSLNSKPADEPKTGKVGRPRKLLAIQSFKTKKMRGRPKKMVTNDCHKLSKYTDNGLKTKCEMNLITQIIKNRVNGNQENNSNKKPKLNTEMSDKFKQLLDKHSLKRKRGRPPKLHTICANNGQSSLDSKANGTLTNGNTAIKYPSIGDKFKQILDRHKHKRGRGRPPKNVEQSDE